MKALLSFHAWSTNPIFWNSMPRELLHNSIVKMISMVKPIVPRADGQGWKIQKFHEHLHVSTDVEMFGSPKIFDTGIMENRLIHVGKGHAQSIQKFGPKLFTRQLGQHIHQQQCTDKCSHYMSTFVADNIQLDSDSNSEETNISVLSDPSCNGTPIIFTNIPDYKLIKSTEQVIQYYQNRCTRNYHSLFFKFHITPTWQLC
jgi:hypothetical protein